MLVLLTLENFPNYLEAGVAVSPWALPYFLSYVFVVVFTVLNVLIGVVLNAMDEAREENRERAKRLGQLTEIVDEVETMTEDGKISAEEMKKLREKVARMERILYQCSYAARTSRTRCNQSNPTLLAVSSAARTSHQSQHS